MGRSGVRSGHALGLPGAPPSGGQELFRQERNTLLNHFSPLEEKSRQCPSYTLFRISCLTTSHSWFLFWLPFRVVNSVCLAFSFPQIPSLISSALPESHTTSLSFFFPPLPRSVCPQEGPRVRGAVTLPSTVLISRPGVPTTQ